jgi:protein SCO1/2
MSTTRWLSLPTLCVALVMAGCKGESADKSKSESAKEYDIKGKIMAIDLKKPAVTLDHEDVPGLMKAMEMEFAVADRKMLESLKVGDQVTGRLKKTESGYLITRLDKGESTPAK